MAFHAFLTTGNNKFIVAQNILTIENTKKCIVMGVS